MTLAAACGWSLFRSLAVALAAWPVCRRQSDWVLNLDCRSRRRVWIVLLIPFLCPELWIGYAWSGFALRLAGTEFWKLFPAALFPTPQAIVSRDAAVDELLLDILLFFRALPVGTLAVYFAPPPPLSGAAVHCRELALGRDAASADRGRLRIGWLRFALNGRWHTALPAMALMFLVLFQNFELASLIGRPAWTVWLFDAQAGGLVLQESLRLSLLPVVCQVLVLSPVAWWILTSRSLPAARVYPPTTTSRRSRIILSGLLIAALTVTLLVPVLFVGTGILQGLVRIFQNGTQLKSLFKEILIGTGYALAAALASVLAATRLWRAAHWSRLARAVVLACSLPGLFGSLVLSLALIQLFQQPFVHVFYKTPPALAIGLALFLFPRALALRFLLSSSRQREGAHLAKLLGESPLATVRAAGHELTWQFKGSREFWGIALLTYWGFLELTIAYLLAPVTIVSAPVMLYNQMHFGKNATLSALVLVTVLVPALLFLLASVSRRLLFRWLWR